MRKKWADVVKNPEESNWENREGEHWTQNTREYSTADDNTQVTKPRQEAERHMTINQQNTHLGKVFLKLN